MARNRTRAARVGLGILALWIALSGRALAQAASNDVSACGIPVYPPLSWVESGSIRGVAPTLVKKVFEGLGYKVHLNQVGNWKRCLREVEEGHIDIVVGLFYHEARERYLVYSTAPIIEEPMVFFYNKARPVRFDRWEDLKGLRVGMLLGDTFGAEADEKIERFMSVERVSSGEQNFGKLMYGRIDLMPLGLYGGSLQAQKMGYGEEIDHLDRPLASDFWYVGISKKSPLVKHIPHLNNEITRMSQNGEIQALMDRFSAEYILPTVIP
ncbi:ABC transporter substrate-binding protein [Motiliproteus sp. SC1-56]|uniref:substrate-binding periplasmic protein n=1 Tax=Motiliproteus sp. SC1-56 TaxID=2799565 RepID=UPI001A8DAE54|nr:transporter substrate-binding domain-containing protein [Motiliproteus sp. SC1-56]